MDTGAKKAMRYISEFRNPKLVKQLAQKIKHLVVADKTYRIMEFCGGHTHAIYKFGLPSILPSNLELVHGPGCPVCVLPISRLDYAIAISKLDNLIFCTYGDMLRVPGTQGMSLLKAKAEGACVKVVYSVDDALAIARANPKMEVVFFAIGFETTTPPTAVALKTAKQEKLTNFSVFCNHVLTPSAMQAILMPQNNKAVALDGFIGPAHVSIIIGSKAYDTIAQQYQKPIVISGFEPLDIMHSILLLVECINQSQVKVVNQYQRAVDPKGNLKSQRYMAETFSIRDAFEWRGLGSIAHSALMIHPNYQAYDAESRFTFERLESKEHKACDCGGVLKGEIKPTDCKLFAKACTPENPLGSCMVSSEGACAAYFAYKR